MCDIAKARATGWGWGGRRVRGMHSVFVSQATTQDTTTTTDTTTS